MPPRSMSPLVLGRAAEPFDAKDWLYELKYDGYRALLYLDRGGAQLVSRNGNRFTRFGPLGAELAGDIHVRDAVIDGEVVCLDRDGRPRFDALFYGRGSPIFVAFDLLWMNGRDYRGYPLLYRSCTLATVIPSGSSCVLRAEHVLERGVDLFRLACERDLEGIVAKQAQSPYGLIGDRSPWLKIKNRTYSQRAGRHEMFTRSARRS